MDAHQAREFAQAHGAAQPLILNPASESLRRDDVVVGVSFGEGLPQSLREEAEKPPEDLDVRPLDRVEFEPADGVVRDAGLLR